VCLLRGTFYPHSVFVCFLWIWEQTAIISLYSVNWLVFITETECLLRGTFCPHSVFMCFVWIWEQRTIISLYSINWLVFITEAVCVYCAVRTEYLNETVRFTPNNVQRSYVCLLLNVFQLHFDIHRIFQCCVQLFWITASLRQILLFHDLKQPVTRMPDATHSCINPVQWLGAYRTTKVGKGKNLVAIAFTWAVWCVRYLRLFPEGGGCGVKRLGFEPDLIP
jgi:hypothetical protein